MKQLIRNKLLLRVAALTITAVMCTLVILSAVFPFPEGTYNFLSIGTSQKASANPDWLSGWSYYKPITVTNASADYQTKIFVGESSGALSYNVSCDGYCQSDFDDLRFTSSDGTTLLDYWVESTTGTSPNQTATVWVQNDATPSTTGRMYYGNPEAISASNGSNTFIFFDTFETENWKRQGNCIENEATLAGIEPTIMYEGSPQILTGETNVFKLWYNHSADIHYAESSDGLNWTEYDSNPIIVATLNRPHVVKESGAYYLYASPSDTGIKRYHSSDGVTSWTDDGTVLSLGAAGKWDDANIANCFVFVEDGTWRMLYDGTGTGTGGKWWTGYATSSNGTSWTKQNSGNAVITTYGGGAGYCQKIDSYYWFWTWGGATGCGLPTDMYRHRSTDLITWTNLPAAGSTFPRTTADEGAGSSYGQVADTNLLEHNNQVYMWYAATTDGRTGTDFHLKLARIDKTVAQLVAINEDYYSLTDQWAGATSRASIASSVLTFSYLVGDASVLYTSATFSTGVAFRSKRQQGVPSPTNWNMYGLASTTLSTEDIIMLIVEGGGIYHRLTKASTQTTPATNWSTGSYKTVDILRQSTRLDFLEEGIARTGSPYTDTTYISTATIPIILRNPGASQNILVDWVLVRKYLATEPTFAFGSEQVPTPTVTNTPNSKNFGVLEVNTTSNTDINYFTLNNTGNCAVNVVIYGTDVTGGDDTWDLSDTATPGENIYGLYAGLDDADDLFDIIVRETATYNTLVSDLAEGVTQAWGLKIYMPTSVSSYDAQQMSGTITLVASASS